MTSLEFIVALIISNSITRKFWRISKSQLLHRLDLDNNIARFIDPNWSIIEQADDFFERLKATFVVPCILSRFNIDDYCICYNRCFASIKIPSQYQYSFLSNKIFFITKQKLQHYKQHILCGTILLFAIQFEKDQH